MLAYGSYILLDDWLDFCKQSHIEAYPKREPRHLAPDCTQTVDGCAYYQLTKAYFIVVT